MAHKNLFNTKALTTSSCLSNSFNDLSAGHQTLHDKTALVEYAMTGCFNGVYSESDPSKIKKFITLSKNIEPEFLAKLAIYSHKNRGFSDASAILTAILAHKNSKLLPITFNRVIDSPKTLKNFVQVIRSGAIGRQSLGTRPKKLIQNYLESLTDEQIFKANIGNNPSIKDIIKMVHPKPSSPARNALYSYLLNKKVNDKLSPIIKDYENFKRNSSGHIPNVPFQMLSTLPISQDYWKQIAAHATWKQVCANLTTFVKHNVFEDKILLDKIVKKISDKNQISLAKALPFEVYVNYKHNQGIVPVEISNALETAVNLSINNIPFLDSKIYLMVDVSKSMHYPVSYNGSSTSKVSYLDIASLLAYSLMSSNPGTEIIPFDTEVHLLHNLNSQDSVSNTAKKLSSLGRAGTSCAKALEYINSLNAKADAVIYISDNSSWLDSSNHNKSAPTMVEWVKFKQRNPQAKLINIDIQPYKTIPSLDQKDTLNVAGFSDNIFNLIFNCVKNTANIWMQEVDSIIL